jgi:hypothetical protein
MERGHRRGLSWSRPGRGRRAEGAVGLAFRRARLLAGSQLLYAPRSARRRRGHLHRSYTSGMATITILDYDPTWPEQSSSWRPRYDTSSATPSSQWSLPALLGQRLREPGNALVADEDQRLVGEVVGVPDRVLGAEEGLHLLVRRPTEPASELGKVRRGLGDDRRLLVVRLKVCRFVGQGVDIPTASGLIGCSSTASSHRLKAADYRSGRSAPARTRRSGTPACFAHVPHRRIAGRAGYRS